MTEKLEGMLAELKQVAPRLRDYEPTGETWRQAEKLALDVRDQVESLLRSPQGVLQLRGCGALQDMKRLVPEVTCVEIAELNVSDFVLGMIFETPFGSFERVYRGFGSDYAKELSKEARKSSYAQDYGEILFFPFADMIRWVAPFLPERAVFYDLGAGIGKAVIAASLLHPFEQAIGIELLEPLVRCADKRKASLEKLEPRQVKTDIDFLTGSLLSLKWEDGDVVFCHGTCFDDTQWSQISLTAEKLKQGAFFISTTHIFRTGLFEVVKSFNFKMSSGSVTAYVHRRRKIGRWAANMLRGGRSTRTDLWQQSSSSQARQKDKGQDMLADNDASAGN